MESQFVCTFLAFFFSHFFFANLQFPGRNSGKAGKVQKTLGHLQKNTLLRVIPTMTFIHLLIGKSSSILPDISSGILSGISSGILSGILSGISSGILSDISSGILSGILSGISSGILSGKYSGILSGISSGYLAHLSGISHGILSGISSGSLSDILSGISSGILSGRWGPAVHTELGRSQVEVQRCTLSWEGPRLRSSGAH